MFLPANTTALIQPMDQGVLEAVKRRYRKVLLRRLLLEEGRSITEFCKKINIKDVIYMSAAAWDISPVTLTWSWRQKLGQIDGDTTALSTDHELDDTSVSSSCEALLRELDSNLDDSDISNWLNADADDQGYQLLSDSEIIQQVTSQQQEEPPLEDETPEDEVEDCSVPSSGG